MADLQNYSKLIEFLSDKYFFSDQEGKIVIESDEYEIEQLIGNEHDSIYENFTKHNDDGYKTVDKNQSILGFLIYPSKEFFFKEFRKLKTRSLIVYDKPNENFYGWIDNKEYKNDEEVNDNKESFFYEITQYLAFENLWKKEAQSSANLNFGFIDYYNQSNKTFLLVSTGSNTIINEPTEYSPFDLEDDKLNCEMYVENFKNIIGNKSNKLSYFLKNEIIRRSDKKVNNLLNIFKNFDSVYQASYKSFLIYIEDISIEKLKDEYAEFKNEYLKSYSDLISKILLKIISAPITFGAITFALSRIKSEFLVFILLLGLYSTSILIYFSLKSHLSDLRSLTNQLESKCNHLKDKNFDLFNKFSEEMNELENTLDSIKEKISLSKTFLFSSYSMTFLFASVIGVYVLFFNLKKVISHGDITYFKDLDYLYIITTTAFILYSLYIAYKNYNSVKLLTKNIDLISFKSKIRTS